ncbi:MAG: hypothetical protein JSU82_12805 [Rhodospirillales bacterium]|nr:MAG: hypothetical protein JSU82_12805 [Rhodospirillales bacterium]
MPPRNNPLKLNKLQLKTLAILQELAADPTIARRDATSGGTQISAIPAPHGDHFHVGTKLVLARDATGLANEGVWMALIRKGLAGAAAFPHTIVLTPAGLGYDTSEAGQILHGADH